MHLLLILYKEGIALTKLSVLMEIMFVNAEYLPEIICHMNSLTESCIYNISNYSEFCIQRLYNW